MGYRWNSHHIVVSHCFHRLTIQQNANVYVIASLPKDFHASSISWALEEYGHKVFRLYHLDLCDGGNWSLDPSIGDMECHNSTLEIRFDFSGIDSVWNRRVGNVIPLNLDLLEIKERAAAETELGELVTGAMFSLSSNAFAVNPHQNDIVASRKAYQLNTTHRVGFNTPKTIITNDFSRIKVFLRVKVLKWFINL